MVLSDGLRWLAIASRSERKSNLEIIGLEVCEIVCGVAVTCIIVGHVLLVSLRS